MKNKIHIIANNFASMTFFHTQMTREEINSLLEIYGEGIFCRGHWRRFVFKKVWGKFYNVTTVEA